jgi:hypothetical protein
MYSAQLQMNHWDMTTRCTALRARLCLWLPSLLRLCQPQQAHTKPLAKRALLLLLLLLLLL